MWVVKLIKTAFPFQIDIARLTKVPLVGGLIEHMMFEDDDIMLLPRETVVSVGEAVPAGEDIVVPSKVIEHFIDEASFLWIMNTCICRESMKCKDYPVDLGCMFLGEAARDINPKLGRSVSKEEALEHLERCREAGLYHLVGRNKLDSLWLNVHPGNQLLTICNCCTCCCLWRMLPVVAQSVSSKLTRMPGVTVKVSDRCVGCGTCAEETGCIARAISLRGERAFISVDCRGCGRCAEVCPEGAIDVEIDDADFMRRSIERISDKVDVT
jgi:ferredoxin